jgi:uncharacterized beta-barrel protein YwiB (DUF1934 family)
MKTCLLTLKTVSVPAGGEADIIELTSAARFSVFKNGTKKIKYSESEAAGYEGAQTELFIGEDFARIKRSGVAEMCLRLDLVKKHYSVYKTPYGEINLGVVTHKLENNMTENGGEAHLKYSLLMNSVPFTENEIFVKIKI